MILIQSVGVLKEGGEANAYIPSGNGQFVCTSFCITLKWKQENKTHQQDVEYEPL